MTERNHNYLSIQLAVDFIEEHLLEVFSLLDVARTTGYSMYHFDKLFKYTVGDSCMEYVRKRRLTEAARELLSTRERIIDLALKYGFGSQQAFTLAFCTNFKIPPGKYRRRGKQLAFFERRVLTQEYLDHLQVSVTREPQIIFKDCFSVVGLELFGSNSNGDIPALWERFMAALPQVCCRVDSGTTLGICDFVPDYDPVKSEFSYLACVQVSDFRDLPPGMVGREIPPSRYAVFTHRGDVEKLEETYRYIYGVYFPKSQLMLAETADFEVYDQRFQPGREESELDIYIPIR